MKIKFLLASLFLLGCNLVHSQNLQFTREGKFRIVQFTDIHYKANENSAKQSLDLIAETLENEKPDLVVFTGDVVVEKPNKQGWDEVLKTVIDRKIPYVVTLGNHDDEGDTNRKELAEYISKKPYLVNKKVELPSVAGFLNGVFTINGQDGKPKAILYAMDSHAYSTNKRVEGYGWFAHNQVSWYRKTAASLIEKHQKTLPALAFFHIPLPEYRLAFDNTKNARMGTRNEPECAPDINTGMFAAMVELGDVMGTFVGHDHKNDYLVDYYGIALTYGACTRADSNYKRNIAGARIIELTEGERGFSTFIRELGGQHVQQVNYPF